MLSEEERSGGSNEDIGDDNSIAFIGQVKKLSV
jgi:hypothetical protein